MTAILQPIESMYNTANYLLSIQYRQDSNRARMGEMRCLLWAQLWIYMAYIHYRLILKGARIAGNANGTFSFAYDTEHILPIALSAFKVCWVEYTPRIVCCSAAVSLFFWF